MVNFGDFLKTWSLRSNSVTRQISFNRTKIWWKMPKIKNQMRHFLVIFKHCDSVWKSKKWLFKMSESKQKKPSLLFHFLFEVMGLVLKDFVVRWAFMGKWSIIFLSGVFLCTDVWSVSFSASCNYICTTLYYLTFSSSTYCQERHYFG